MSEAFWQVQKKCRGASFSFPISFLNFCYRDHIMVKVGIVGLGRWAKVLSRSLANSQKINIVAGYSRSEEKRKAFEQEIGIPAAPDMNALLSNPDIEGVILTVPNEQ